MNDCSVSSSVRARVLVRACVKGRTVCASEGLLVTGKGCQEQMQMRRVQPCKTKSEEKKK